MSNLENKEKSYAIIGFGNIGQALAKSFARKGIEVSVATTRDPKALHRRRPQSGLPLFLKHWQKP
jgi:predicted dinucleotide-binding enzyme